MIALGASASEPILHEVAGFEVWLPHYDDLVLRVQLLDIFLLLEHNFRVFGNVKGQRCGMDLRQSVLVPLVGFWKS